MKRIINAILAGLFAALITALIIFLLTFAAMSAQAQSDTCADSDNLVIDTVNKRYKCLTPGALPPGTGTTMIIANEAGTGTTVNRLAKLTGAPSTAIITATTDTENAVGIVTGGAGIAGNATITILGQASCEFDGATVAGNYFVISAITTGMCHDAGSSFPTAQAAYGRVLSTNVGAGTYVVELMTPDIAFQNAGNGKSKPGTPLTAYQYNGSGTFTGGEIARLDANTTEISNGTSSTAIRLNLYGLKNGATFERAWIRHETAGPNYLIGVDAGGAGTQRTLGFAIGSAEYWRISTAGLFSSFNSASRIAVENGAANNPSYQFGGSGGTAFKGMYGPAAADIGFSTSSTYRFRIGDNGAMLGASERFLFSSTALGSGVTADTGIGRNAAGVIEINNGTNGTFRDLTARNLNGATYTTTTNCADSAGAAACGSAAAGSVVIDAGATTVVVSTTAVTANSQIFVQYDSSLGTRLSVTCNTTPALPAVTARTAVTSFTITVPAAPVTNPACYSYYIVN